MKINTKKAKQQWFTYEEGDEKAEFCIRPYPFSHIKLERTDLMSELLDQFMYCLVDWKGMSDDEDKPFKYSKENAQYIFDHVPELREWIFARAREVSDGVHAQSKN